MPFIKLNSFKGTNTEQENIPSNVMPFAFNADTSKGRISKRGGLAELLDLSTTGSPKGIHTAKFSSGETIVVGADDKAYKLSGTAETEVVTTTAEFALGTFDTQLSTVGDKVSIDTSVSSVSSTVSEYSKTLELPAIKNNFEFTGLVRWFIPGGSADWDSKIKFQSEDSQDLVEVWLVNHNDDPAEDFFKVYIDGVLVHSVNYVMSDNDVIKVEFIESGGSFTVNIYDNDTPTVVDKTYSGSHGGVISKAYGVADGREDYYYDDFYFYYTDYEDGEYISKIYDLTQTPVLNTLLFNKTIPSGEGTITIYAKGSSDGVRFGDWGVVTLTGDSINLNRYIQIRLSFEKTKYSTTTFSLDDFTISYTTAFDTKTQFDSGLTGNKIRWVNYQGQESTTTGSITSSTASLVVADATGFAIGQTIIIDGAGLSSAYLEAVVSNVVGTTITLDRDALTTVTAALVRIELYGTKYYVYYCDGTTVAKYDGTTVTDIETVPDSNIIYEHKNYMFYVPSSDPTRLYFSDLYGTTLANPLGDFELVSAFSYKKFPDVITGLKTFEGKLVVSGPNFTAFVTGDIFGGASDNTSVYIIDDIGAVNHESMSICTTATGTILSLVTKDGVRYLTGGTYENALQQKPLSDAVRSYINNGNFDNAYSHYSDGRLYVGFNSGVVPTDYVDSILVFDFTNGLVIDGIWDIALNDVTEFNGKLYGSSSDTTNLYELFSGTSDNGSDITLKAVMRFKLDEYQATLMNLKIKATTDSDFIQPTSCDIIISADNHSRTLDLKESTWRESTSYYSQFKGQDLMESRRQIKRRGTFIEFNIVSASKYKLEFDSFEIEYGGVRK